MFAFITTLVSWIWNGIQATADFMVTVLTVAYHVLRVAGTAVWDAAKWTWGTIIRPVGVFLEAAYTRLKTLYASIVAPVLDWTQRIVTTLKKLYATYVQPLMDAVDGVRRMLELLQLLHVQLAKQIDDALATLERKISAPLLLAIQTINVIDNRLESYVLTVDNLFQRATHLNSIRRDLNPILNFQWNRTMGNVKGALAHVHASTPELTPIQDHGAFFSAAIADNAKTKDPLMADLEAYFAGAFEG
ncbi:MAG: hypothetical protein LAO77_23175 [Acidobacteriia bacterium]|nr:hypothetical protein [Terriglobia bacterium]